MSRGDDSFPRYTYMMDFNPDEDTPLRDYWHTADDLDHEDAATIASLATQALQAKSYGYGDGQVSESLVANYMYSESRSSPQSQYSTAMQAEPAESFRGLMEDHDRGAQMAEENAVSDYDFHHETRGHVSDEVAGMEEPSALAREQHGHGEEHYAHDSFRPLLSVAAADENLSHTYQVEMSAAMTASRVVNGVLRRSYASTPNEMDVDPMSLQPQAPLPTSPRSESSPVSVETPEVVEPEQEVTIADDEHHVDGEPETAPIVEDEKGNDDREEGEEDGLEHESEILSEQTEERRVDGEREEQVRVEAIEQAGEMSVEEIERSKEVGVEEEDAQMGEDQEQEETDETHKDDSREAQRKEPGGDQRDEAEEAQREKEARSEAEVQQQLILEYNERPTTDDSEDLPPPQPAPRKRGRPRKSDAALAPPDPVSEQLQAAEVSVHEETIFVREAMETTATGAADLSRAEVVPTGRTRGRPRKSEVSEAAPPPRPRSASAKRRPGRPPKSTTSTTSEAMQMTMVSTGKRGRPRKSSMANGTQAPSVETSAATPPTSGKRGRPRKSETMEASVQLPATEVEVPKSVPGKRGRPRKSEAIPTSEAQLATPQPAASAARSLSRRGRPRKSETADHTHTSANETQPSMTEAAAVESAQPTASSAKRGRPRKSEATPIHEARVPVVEVSTLNAGKASSAVRTASRRGRPRKRDASTHEAYSTDLERTTAGTATPTARSSSRRGRPRKSDTSGEAQASAVDSQPPAVEAVGVATPAARPLSRRGRPRKSDPLATAQASIDELQLSADEAMIRVTARAARSLSRRGRPRKRDTLDATQALPDDTQGALDETRSEATRSAARSLSRRGRPRKRDTLDRQDSPDGFQRSTEGTRGESTRPVARSLSRRGRPRKRDAGMTQMPTGEDTTTEIMTLAARSSSRRGRPRKRHVTGENRQASANEPQLPPAQRSTSAARSSSRRGRPRKIDGMSDPPTQMSAASASATTTPALGKRGRPRSASVASSTTGKRGRPPKNTIPLLPAEIEALSSDNPTTTAVSTFSIPLGQPIRAFLEDDETEEEEEAAPPSLLSVTKRGRGRPPKSPALLPVDVPNSAPEADRHKDIWEFDPQSPINKRVPRMLTAHKKAPRPSQEAAEETPVRERGRRKSVAVEQPLPAVDVSVASPTKKRGRPPKATAAIQLAEEDGLSAEVEASQDEEFQDEEGPMTKRIRTDNDISMEDAVYEDEPQRQTLEGGELGVPEPIETTAPSHTAHQPSAPDPIESRSLDPRGKSSAASGLPRSLSPPDVRPRVPEESPRTTEMLDKGTQTKAVEKPPAEPPRSIFELLAGGRRTNKVQKTYGKRFKRL